MGLQDPNNALVDPPGPGGTRTGRDTIAALVADYEDGQPTTTLMRTYAIGKGTVLQLLRDAGVQIRKPGPRPGS